MAKKDQQNEIKFVPGTFAEQEPVQASAPAPQATLYESEAYGNPQPDQGVKTTVMKPVGMGGPVPIVAPKHNTIQLQPIIVPLAVVPYMTQDSDVLRTDGKTAAYSAPDYGEATEFGNVSADASVRKRKTASTSRAFAGIMLFLSLMLTAAFLLAKFYPVMGKFSLEELNVIDIVAKWADKIKPENMTLAICYCVTAGMTVLLFITSLVSLFAGKYPRTVVILISLFIAAGMIVAVSNKAANSALKASSDIGFIVTLTIAALVFAMSVIFAAVSSRRERAEEEINYNEI